MRGFVRPQLYRKLYRKLCRGGASDVGVAGPLRAAGRQDLVNHVAFRNPDGRIVLIITNSGSAVREFEVICEGYRLSARSEATSIMTLIWPAPAIEDQKGRSRGR